MKNVYTTTIRLNLNSKEDRKAWERLQGLDKQRCRSISKTIVMALNDYFDRQERMLHDSYLETREKEDAFLSRVLDTIAQGMNAVTPIGALGSLLPLLQSGQSTPVVPADDDGSMDAALDFANSF